MSDEAAKVLFADSIISLEQLANIDLSNVAEKRFTRTPAGTFQFVIDAENMPKLEKMGDGEKAKAGIAFFCKIEAVMAVKDTTEVSDPASLLGKMHRETFFLGSDDDFGYLVAFLHDIGVEGKGTLPQILAQSVGKRFQASVVHRKNPNDTDRPYVNLNRDKGKIISLAA